MKKTAAAGLLVLSGLYALGAQPPLTGLWDATIKVNDAVVPFHVQFSGSGSNFKAWFFDGDRRTISTSGEATSSTVKASFAQYNSRLEATLKDGALEGTYTRDGKTYPVRAVPLAKPAPPKGAVPEIAGDWVVETGDIGKSERAWHLVLRQTGPQISGDILRVDGDTGALTGRFEDGRFTISHFSGARPSVFVLTPQPDGSLEVLQNGKNRFTAVRAAVAKAKGLPGPEDPTQHTKLRNPNEPLRFSFPDLNGHQVSSTDPRFKGKVVIVSIGGSWCPNCHDEAPLLEGLYRKFRSQGLEIVELSFEEEDQLKNPTRLREFIKEYGIDYTVLLAGEPSQLAEKLPQAVNLDTFPATFFVGRDGLVKAIHAGFAGKAMGRMHDELVEEINTTVARLLAAK